MFGAFPFGGSYFGQGPALVSVIGPSPFADVIVQIKADDVVCAVRSDDVVIAVKADDDTVVPT